MLGEICKVKDECTFLLLLIELSSSFNSIIILIIKVLLKYLEMSICKILNAIVQKI